MPFCMSHSIMHSLIQQVFVVSILNTKHGVQGWDPCDQIYVVKRGFQVVIFEMCRTSHQALMMGVTWAWEERRSQGWNPVFLTWLWLGSIVIHWNEECWNFGEAYDLTLVELTWKSAFLKGFCSLSQNFFLIYFKNVHINVNVCTLYVWDIILSGAITVIVILTHLLLIEILVRDRIAILTPIYVKEKNENSKYLSA